MRALRFARSGKVEDVLRLEDVPDPAPGPGEVLVAVGAAAINPSDVKNVNGAFPDTTLPRIPGRAFAGVVVDGPAELRGKTVWGAGGEFGFTRDGAHAEKIVVPAGAVAIVPPQLDAAGAAGIALDLVAAWCGVHDAIRLRPGETILVTGANGGVGTTVVQLARWAGARTIGYDRRPPEPSMDAALKPDVSIVEGEDLAARVRAQTGGQGADAAYDTVGSPTFDAVLAALAHRGRWAIISSAGDRRASLDVLDFYHAELTLSGIDTRKRDGVAAAAILALAARGFEQGRLAPPHVTQTIPLAGGVEGYRRAAARALSGKAVLVP